MNTKPIIQKRKFIGDIPEEEAKIIDAACIIEKRSKISLIRFGAVKYAQEVLKNSKSEVLQAV